MHEYRRTASSLHLASGPVSGSRRGGVAVLELMVAFPLLTMLCLGAAEYGYYIYAKNILQDAAQIAAQLAVDDTATDAKVNAEIASTMNAAGFGSKGYTVTKTPASVNTIATGTETTISISCPWVNFGVHILPTSMGGIDPNKPVTGSATMIRE